MASDLGVAGCEMWEKRGRSHLSASDENNDFSFTVTIGVNGSCVPDASADQRPHQVDQIAVKAASVRQERRQVERTVVRQQRRLAASNPVK